MPLIALTFLSGLVRVKGREERGLLGAAPPGGEHGLWELNSNPALHLSGSDPEQVISLTFLGSFLVCEMEIIINTSIALLFP